MIIFQLKIFVFSKVAMSFLEVLSQHKYINQNFTFTAEKLPIIRAELLEKLAHSQYKDKMCIIVTGSYGRYEASSESDMDLFWFIDADIPDEPAEALKEEIKIINDVIINHVPKEAGSTGTFGPSAIVSQSKLIGNIGGKNDSNENMTRRMLLLLEGTYLYNNDKFIEIRKNLIDKYIKVEQNPKQIPRFLLNDIIRYYRTIATDFEFKVSEDTKEWGLRNIKLKFSRKFLYFGGLIAVAELMNIHDIDAQKAKLEEIFDKTVFEKCFLCARRVDLIPQMNQIFGFYNNFIEKISTPENRIQLEATTKNTRNDSALYQELRDDGNKFSEAMEIFLTKAFGKQFISLLIF